MDIGNEVRRYRAEPLASPVPGVGTAPHEQAPDETAPARSTPARTAPDRDDRHTQEAAVEAHA